MWNCGGGSEAAQKQHLDKPSAVLDMKRCVRTVAARKHHPERGCGILSRSIGSKELPSYMCSMGCSARLACGHGHLDVRLVLKDAQGRRGKPEQMYENLDDLLFKAT